MLGRLQGGPDAILKKGLQWMADRAARIEAPVAGYVATRIGNAIQAVCRRAWEMPCIGRIITPSGCGKTAALQEFARLRGDRALYLQAGQAFSQDSGFLLELASKLGLRPVARDTKATLFRAIRDRLAGYYAGGNASPFCLLIDEATTLRPSCLNMLRNLHDDPSCRAAIVLADTWRLDAELHSRTGLRQMAGGYEQLLSRFGAECLLAVDAAISSADVRKVAESLLHKLSHDEPLSQDALKFLTEMAQEGGKLRNVVHRLHAVHDVAIRAGFPARYDVAQLDYVASLVGQKPRREYQTPPFSATNADGDGDGRATELRRA